MHEMIHFLAIVSVIIQNYIIVSATTLSDVIPIIENGRSSIMAADATISPQPAMLLPPVVRTSDGCLISARYNETTNNLCFKDFGTYLSTGHYAANCSDLNTCGTASVARGAFGVNFASPRFAQLQIPDKSLMIRFLGANGERRIPSWKFSDGDEYMVALDWLEPMASLRAIVLDRIYPTLQPLITKNNLPRSIPIISSNDRASFSSPNFPIEAIFSPPGYSLAVTLQNGSRLVVTKTGPSVQEMLSAHNRYFGTLPSAGGSPDDQDTIIPPTLLAIASIDPAVPAPLPSCPLKFAIHVDDDISQYPNWLDFERTGVAPSEFTCIQKGEESLFLQLLRAWRRQFRFTLEAAYVDSGTTVFFDFQDARSIELQGDRSSKMGVALDGFWPTKVIIR